MTNTVRLTAAALAIFLVGQLTRTQTASADESTPLVELCKSFLALPKSTEVTTDYIQLKSSCAGFINSAVRMSKPEDGFCRPKAYNKDDLARYYLDWAEKHPDRWKDPTRMTIAEALTEVYPCPK